MSDPRALLLAEAVRRLGVSESPPGSNRSARIDYWNTEAQAPLGSPWCLSFVRQMTVEAVGRSRTPWPVTASVQALVTWAEARGCFTADVTQARPGDLIVWWYPSLNRHGHVAVLERIEDGRTVTIDGNSNAGGSREGFAVVRKARPITERTRVVRWPEAAP